MEVKVRLCDGCQAEIDWDGSITVYDSRDRALRLSDGEFRVDFCSAHCFAQFATALSPAGGD